MFPASGHFSSNCPVTSARRAMASPASSILLLCLFQGTLVVWPLDFLLSGLAYPGDKHMSRLVIFPAISR
jgi:hypothetical protein